MATSDKRDDPQQLLIKPIGILRSPFTEKFGIPRQANLIQSAYAEVKLHSPFNNPDALSGLENFSHIWLTFNFHLNNQEKWRPMIRPPRLGGNKKVGVFASRSPFRPNNLGQSLVALREIKVSNHQASIIIACPDLLDGTPIYDIKPYIHYADSNDKAECAFAETQPQASLKVAFSPECLTKLAHFSELYPSDLKSLIEEVISYDPRPAYKQSQQDKRTYKLRLYDLDLSFSVNEGLAYLDDISQV